MRRRSRIEALSAFFRPAHGGSASLLLSGERFAAAQTLIGAYYAVLFFFAAGELFSWQGYLNTGELAPRWPVFWLRFVDTRAGIAAILWLHLLGGLLAVALFRYRWARVVVFVALLEHIALKFSFGAVNHGDHLGVLIGFVLIFLPAGWHSRGAADRTVRAATLLVFSGAQALILLTYSMAGMWKAGGIVEQWLRGELVTYLHPQGLAHQVAAKMIEDDAASLLGPWLVGHPWIGWLPGTAAIYLELFALWVVARPSLHRAWGLGLALFHLVSHLTLGVGFPQNVLWLALFLVLSPFQPREPDWRQAASDLPVLGAWLRRKRSRAEAPRPSKIRLLTRTFEVPVPLPEAWQFLARVHDWPRWARHIRRVDVTSAGPVGPESSGCIHLRNGIRSTFRMREFRPGQSWKWVGPFLWLTVHYDHQFQTVDASRTRLTWVVDAEGFGAAVFGRLFAAIYSRNLDKAIPALVSSLSQTDPPGGAVE